MTQGHLKLLFQLQLRMVEPINKELAIETETMMEKRLRWLLFGDILLSPKSFSGMYLNKPFDPLQSVEILCQIVHLEGLSNGRRRPIWSVALQKVVHIDWHFRTSCRLNAIPDRVSSFHSSR